MTSPSKRLARWQFSHETIPAGSASTQSTRRQSTPRQSTPAWTDPPVIRAAVMSVAAAGWLIAPGWPMAAVGLLAVLVAPTWLAGLETRSARRQRREKDEVLPLAVDLLAAVLATGLPVVEAVGEVAKVVPGPLRDDLAQWEQSMRMGARESQIAHHDTTTLARVQAALARSQRWGAAASDELVRLSRQLRTEQRRRGEAEVRRISVRTAAPLGLCFLPAFTALVVVPAVYGAFLPVASR